MVHHKVIPGGDRGLFYGADNLVPLCNTHHTQVHAAYGRGLDWASLTGARVVARQSETGGEPREQASNA